MDLDGTEDSGLDMDIAPVVQNEEITIQNNVYALLNNDPIVEIRNQSYLDNLKDEEKEELGHYDDLLSFTLFYNGNVSLAKSA